MKKVQVAVDTGGTFSVSPYLDESGLCNLLGPSTPLSLSVRLSRPDKDR